MRPRYHHKARWTSLTEDAREAIRARVRAGEPYSTIARELNFCRVALRKLCPRPPVPVLHPNYKWLSQWAALSEKNREAIRTKVAAGTRYTDLARETGISPRALANVCPRTVGKPCQKVSDRWAKVDAAAVVNRILAGESYHALARECGIPYGTFHGRVSRLVKQARPEEATTKILSPRNIAERVRRNEQAARVDGILRRAGLNPVSKFVGTEIRKLRPLRPSFMGWRGGRPHVAQEPTKAISPTKPQPLPHGDPCIMDAACWGTGEGDR